MTEAIRKAIPGRVVALTGFALLALLAVVGRDLWVLEHRRAWVEEYDALWAWVTTEPPPAGIDFDPHDPAYYAELRASIMAAEHGRARSFYEALTGAYDERGEPWLLDAAELDARHAEHVRTTVLLRVLFMARS